MSKGNSGEFSLTKGDIIQTIQNLPPKPDAKFLEEWDDIIAPRAIAKHNGRDYKNKRNGLKIRFDPAKTGAPGFEGKDHYHVYNTESKSLKDVYLDENANPVRKGATSSHIIPKKK